MGAQREHVEHQACVLPTGVVRDARNQGAIKGQRAELPTVRPTGEGGGVSAWAAQRVPRGRLITALLMEVVDDVGIQGAARLPEVGQVSALGMEEASGARWKDALAVLKGRLDCASHMAGDVVASILIVQKVPKGAPRIARLTEVESGASSQAAPKVLRAVHHCAKGMAGGNVVFMMEGGFAPKVYMVELITVLHTAVARDVLLQVAQRVPVVVLTIV